ncbi:MAG: 2Fe-2S iron-sulfur cluster-binding protein [Phycisphaerales bacterium]
MPSLTINGKTFEFKPGQTILEVALANGTEIPHYCYHPGLSVVASCRICLAEIWTPNPKTGKLEVIPRLVPTCQQTASDGMVVYSDSPKAETNQKAVMEYLLINHPVDCPVCDKAGECGLQDYSYEYGRGASRFEEDKIKQPKKDVGPNILLYSDRCIMCTRCVRFTREISGTGELMVDGRGSLEQIDVFPGMALDNELASNVVDLCPVGALLDKNFLFQQRVWYLKRSPTIDGITASGDNIWIEHNEGEIYRIKPRTNLDVNTWWITDEVRYGWKFVHREDRLALPWIKGGEPFEMAEAGEAWESALMHVEAQMKALGPIANKKLALLVSPMLTCEDAFLLAQYALAVDPNALLAVGPIPKHGADKTFKTPTGEFTVYAEKAPNARGVRRVLEALAKGRKVEDFAGFVSEVQRAHYGAAIITGNYPSEWVTPELSRALAKTFVVLMDTLPSALSAQADIVLPAATWAEKAGTFENAKNRLQSFPAAIPLTEYVRGEGQMAIELLSAWNGTNPSLFDAAATRAAMAKVAGLEGFASTHQPPSEHERVESDMVMVEL